MLRCVWASCTGVTDPIGLLRALADVLAAGGEIVLETDGSSPCAPTRPRSRFTSRATCTAR